MAKDPVRATTDYCLAVLGPIQDWHSPSGYPDSLGLCVLDSIWSIGVRYQGVVRVLDRYRSLRRDAGADPNSDGAAELLATVVAAGGPDGFATAMGNHQLTSTRGGVLKASAVRDAAQALLDSAIPTTAALRGCSLDNLGSVEARWRAVHGQRSGISWHYLQMLAGVQDVKPDRMILRFVEAATGENWRPATAAHLVMQVAAQLKVEPRSLDHRMWCYQSGRL